MSGTPGIKSKQQREKEEQVSKSKSDQKFFNLASRGRKALKCEELKAYRKEYEIMERTLMDDMIDCSIVDIKSRLSFYDRTCGILFGFRKILKNVDMDASIVPPKDDK